ncbi:hypothetical protein N431DRAFT_51548 [Stipitochalara longipes BDJ]|nr:hypothetical protein N431DRAFT_51548 [Stipitochalara longipes BDJ]
MRKCLPASGGPTVVRCGAVCSAVPAVHGPCRDLSLSLSRGLHHRPAPAPTAAPLHLCTAPQGVSYPPSLPLPNRPYSALPALPPKPLPSIPPARSCP